ncbi:hypothetical protein [Nocardia sp. NPDC006630]|uniref:hypothetical protein n=1 Tax=Nocardia sp. NPDC006630 TaxID=3157181 RepID=UPI0033A7EE91
MTSVPPQADLADLLVQSRKLLDSAISAVGASKTASDKVIRISPDASWGTALHRMLREARNETLLAIADPIRLERSYSRGGSLLQQMHRAGKQVRLLLSPSYAGTRPPDLYSHSFQLDSQVRVAASDFCNTIVIDRKTAVLWTGPQAAEPRGLIVTDPMLLSAIHESTLRTWSASRQFRDHRNGADFNDTAIAIVTLLNSGVKDEVAARRLGVSLRTYRRHVADLMVRLEASNRFQLGVHAAEMGLLRSAQ